MKSNTKQLFAYLLNGYNISVLMICLLILIVPSINDTRLVNSTITGKLIYFLYGCLVLLSLYTIIIVFSKKITFTFSKIDIALFALVFYITLNRYCIQSHYGFSIRFIELLGLSFIYIVLRSISIKNYPWLLLSLVISGIMQAVYGNLQLLGFYTFNHPGYKITGSFFNPGPYAGFLVSIWVVALGMYLFKDNIIAQIQLQIKNNFLFLNGIIKSIFEYTPLLGIITIAIVLPATQSRACWIATIASSVILLEIKYQFLKELLKKRLGLFYKTAILILAIIILSTGLFSLYQYKKESSNGRLFIWKVTTEMITDAPVFGLGFDRFKTEYMNYQANYFAENGETAEAVVADNVYYAFNEGLQFISENGLTGLALLLIALFFIFQTNENSKYQIEHFIAKTGILSIAVFACFSYPTQILPIKLVLVVLLALLSNSKTDCFHFKIRDNQIKTGIYKIQFISLTYGIIYWTFSFTNKLNQSFITWNNALNSYQNEDYKTAIQDFESAYPIFKKEGDFLMNYGKTLSMAGEPHKAITVLEKAKRYQNNTIIETALGDSYKTTRQYVKAEKAYLQAINMTPGKFYANYLLVKLYDESGQENKAVTMAKQLIDKKIKIPSTAITEIQGEMEKILTKYKNPPGFKN